MRSATIIEWILIEFKYHESFNGIWLNQQLGDTSSQHDIFMVKKILGDLMVVFSGI